MNDPQSLAQIVPFGKYRGRSVQEMLLDEQYMNWLTMQPWFREKFAELYETAMRKVSIDAPTPEHNALQARFVDPTYRSWVQALLTRSASAPVQPPTGSTWHSVCTADLPDGLAARVQEQRCMWPVEPPTFQCEWLNWDVAMGVLENSDDPFYWSECATAIELKPSIGDEFPAIARVAKARPTGLRRGVSRSGSASQCHTHNARKVIAFDCWVSTTPLDTARAMFHDLAWVQLPPFSPTTRVGA